MLMNCLNHLFQFEMLLFQYHLLQQLLLILFQDCNLELFLLKHLFQKFRKLFYIPQHLLHQLLDDVAFAMGLAGASDFLFAAPAEQPASRGSHARLCAMNVHAVKATPTGRSLRYDLFS